MVSDYLVNLILIHPTHQIDAVRDRKFPDFFSGTVFQCIAQRAIDYQSRHPSFLLLKSELLHHELPRRITLASVYRCQ